MSIGAALWLLLFAVAALLFFGIAFVVILRGVSDLRDLLDSSERNGRRR